MPDEESEDRAKKLVADAEKALNDAETAHFDAVKDASAADEDALAAVIVAMKLVMYSLENPGTVDQQDVLDALEDAMDANSEASSARASASSTQTVGTNLFLGFAKVALSRGDFELAEKQASRALKQSKKVRDNASDAHIDKGAADRALGKAQGILDRYPDAKK